MADINSFQNAGSFNTETAPGAGYNTPGSNFQNPDWMAFFEKAAARKAEQLAYDRKRQGEQDQRQRDQDRMMAQDRHLAQRDREQAVNQNERDRAQAERARQDAASARPEIATSELRMGPMGRWYDYVDPRAAAAANAANERRGFGSGANIGGRLSTTMGGFDDFTSTGIKGTLETKLGTSVSTSEEKKR